MSANKELSGRIFNIQKYSIYDGDGIRTLIFFKGCNLRCPWCANPEGLSSQFQVMFSQDKCINCGDCVNVCPAGIHYRAEVNGEMKHFVNRNKDCIGCRKCEEICTQNALDIMGKDVTVSELMEIIMQDYDFYVSSGGGVTIGGGEMSLQTDFAVALFSECKKMMINTAVETQGTTRLQTIRSWLRSPTPSCSISNRSIAITIKRYSELATKACVAIWSGWWIRVPT